MIWVILIVLQATSSGGIGQTASSFECYQIINIIIHNINNNNIIIINYYSMLPKFPQKRTHYHSLKNLIF